MEELKNIIKTVLNKIKKHRSLYEKSEQSVRSQLIEPILKGLGWDTENPEEVQMDIHTEEGFPDYHLLIESKPILFFEAKKLVKIKQENIKQLAEYCFGVGMKYGLLSNGAIWILFRSFQEDTTFKERIIWKTDIEIDDMSTITRKLNAISRKNIKNIENLIKKFPILDNIWNSLIEDPSALVKEFVPVFENLIKKNHAEYEFDKFELEDFITEKIKKLIFPVEKSVIEPIQTPTIKKNNKIIKKMKIGSDTYSITNNYDVLVNTGNWLIKKGKLKKEDVPIPAGYRCYLVNTDPIHKNGSKFEQAKRLSNGLYIYTKYGEVQMINNARKLLHKYGYDENLLKITD